jgi:ribosomal protein S17E
MNIYPAGMTGTELDDASLEEVIDNADRKELRDMIIGYMTPEHEKELLKEFIKQMSTKQLENTIEELLYEERNMKIAREFIKDNCPEIAE